MFSEIGRLQRDDGAQLALRNEPASGQPRAILLISHGLSEHSARYQRFAKAMAERGFQVYAHDHRGHGQTSAPQALQGRFDAADGVEKVLGDVLAVRDRAAAAHPGLPVVLFGHSMGGLIALNAAERDPGRYDALAVWNSNFNPGLAGRGAQVLLAAEKMLKGSDTPSPLLSKLTFGAWSKAIADRKTDFDWLSSDENEVARYIADPLCGFDATVSLWIDLFRLSFNGARLERLQRLPSRLPIHLLGGAQDPATNGGREIEWLAERMRKAGLSRVTSVILSHTRHETLNDAGRDAATRDFADWCIAAIAR